MIKSFLKKTIFVVSIFVVFLNIFIGFAFAQKGSGIKVQPAVIEDRANPGETYSFTLKVTNLDANEKKFFLDKQNIKNITEDGLPIFSENEEETSYELSSWIKLPQDFVIIPGGESKEIPFTINIPKNAGPGAHFGGIFLNAKPPKLRTIGAGVGYKVGVIINLRISGEVVENARLREFTTEKLIYSFPIVNFKTKVENMGNVLIRPHGILEITDMRGKQVANIRVNERGSGVFPNSERSYETKWEYDEFAFGRYQALLSLVYGEDGKKTISGAISFWVLPLKPILIVLGSIFFIILFTYLAVKIHIRKKLRSMGVLNKGKNVYIHNKKQSGPISRLTFVVISLLIFIILFMGVLFLLFA